MTLIGICGPMKSGKSAVADRIIQEHGFIPYEVARPLKQIAQIFGFKTETQEDKMKIHPRFGITSREFLQKFGTEVCRGAMGSILPSMSEIWTQLLDDFISEHKDQNIVVADIRFPDEVECIRKHGGILIRIEVNHKTQSSHASETSLKNVEADILIYNTHTGLDKLHRCVDTIVEKIQ